MNAVIGTPARAPQSPIRDFSTSIFAANANATTLLASLSAKLEDPYLESRFDQTPWDFETLHSEVGAMLVAAFGRLEEPALQCVHAILFALYELHVAPIGSERCANQFNPYLIRLQRAIERAWLDAELRRTRPLPADVTTPEGLVEAIRSESARHRASKHPMFDFLERHATTAQLVRFFRSDSSLNIRFFDLIVLALLGSDPAVRGELSQNFWDEAGKGEAKNSHVTLFKSLLESMGAPNEDDGEVSQLGWQGLAGHNLFMLTGLNRIHGFKSLGVMAVTELLDPSQYDKLTRGCRRVGMGANNQLAYYEEHISIDVVHAEGWLSNVIVPLAQRYPERMNDIYVGAQMRLNTCSDYYDVLLETLMQAE
ncbi:Iron-containing redox enzyme [Pararobbsia alpina]|uniref:iron-containing redox enzyme family protein n=1 Tax=Pararobbsia alpina TaxID=621374 RepID=UPI0039A40230